MLEYQNYVMENNYGKCTNFDRCLPAPSMKDHEDMIRLKKSKIAPNMLVELENIFSDVSQRAFLSSSYNKQKFIDLLDVLL